MNDFDHDLYLGTTLREICVQSHLHRQRSLAGLNCDGHLENLVLKRVVERGCPLELDRELFDLDCAGVICLLHLAVASLIISSHNETKL